jgi:hypothetical protein
VLINWLLFPLVLTAASAGHGLLIRRLLGAPSPLLVVPTGFASIVVLCALAMLSPLHSVAWLAIVVPAVAGIGLEVPGLRRRRPTLSAIELLPGWVAVAVFAVYAAPIVLSGDLTFAGYSLTVDIAHHFDLTSWLMAHGTAAPDAAASSQQHVADKLLSSTYPIGFHSLLGASSELLGRELAWLFQPTIAFAAPMASLAAYALLTQSRLSRPLAALGAFVVAQPALLYAYSLQAGFKELFSFTMILLCAALLAETVGSGWRRMAVVLVPVAGGVACFWLTIGPWLAPLVGGFALWLAYGGLRWARQRARVSAPVQLAGAVVALAGIAAALVLLADRVKVPLVVTSQTDLGNLAKPLSGLTAGGIWLTGDYRYPLAERVTLTHVLFGVVMAAGLLGLVAIVRSRLWRLVPLVLALAVTLLVMVPKTGPWIDAKVFAIDSGIVVLVAFIGAGLLVATRRGRIAGWALALVITGGVLYSNGLSYHNVTLAPHDRLDELARIGHEYAGKGPALAPYFDEFAEYFLREADGVGRVNPNTGYFPIVYNEPDIVSDGAKESFVSEFPLLVLRRGPDRIRPPAIYHLVQRRRYYDVWQRRAAKTAIYEHLPLDLTKPRTASACAAVLATMRGSSPGTKLAWATPPRLTTVLPGAVHHNPGWPPGGVQYGLLTLGPGYLDAGMVVPATGTYDVWAGGSFGRRVKLVIDSKDIGTISDQADYIGESTFGATVRLTKGSHNFRLTRGGGSLAPGNGDEARNRFIGPIAIVGPQPSTSGLVVTPVSAAARICRSNRRFAWVERLKPGTPIG